MIPTAETVLSNLPYAIVSWSTTLLCWGIYVHVVMNKMIAFADLHKGGARTYDRVNTRFIMIVNAMLLAFLILEPLFQNFSDMVVVLNVFYTGYLAVKSRTIFRWWRTRKAHEANQILT